ncbi:MAG: hypothetical protein KA436_07630 [Oligoflexales bacterium]|nr:hypothetical protein [Oligoflexales bacterium]
MKCLASGIAATVFLIFSFITAGELRSESPSDYSSDSLSDKELTENIQSLLHKIESRNDNTLFQKDSLGEEGYVHFSDIKRWQNAGKHYAAGYDRAGKLLAMYDLTYQNTRSEEFIVRSILGTIGHGDFNLRELVRVIRRHIHEQKQTDFIANENDGMFVQEDYTKIETILDTIDRKYDLTTSSLFPDKWWEKIPLTEQHVKTKSDPYEGFALSDIDFEKVFTTKRELEEFKKSLATLQERLNRLLDTDCSSLLDELTYQRQENNTYKLIYKEKKSSGNDRPRKIIDFIHYQSTFGNALLQTLSTQALSQLISLAPSVVSAVLGYGIGRWMQLYQQQISFHRARAYEYLVEAELGMKSPFSFLSPEERERGGAYILSHESGILQRIFNPRDKASFHQQTSDELSMVEKNKAWAVKQNHFLRPLSPFFSFSKDSTSEDVNSLLAMASRSQIKKRPLVAINYQNPELIRLKRTIAKEAFTILQFIKIPLPGADILLNYLYSFFVMNDINLGLYWEGRLVSFLYKQEDRYTKELQCLYKQRLNPFELDLEEESRFLERSRAYLAL